MDWEALPYSVLRELRKAVRESGVRSTFTLGILEGVSNGYFLLPQDWKDMCRMVLSPAQYVVWDSEYQREALAAAAQGGGAYFAEQLYGAGQFSGIPEQAVGTPRAAYPIIGQCVRRVFRRVPAAGKSSKSFAVTRQGAAEPFHQFVDRLHEAVQRQIDNPQAQTELMIKLAYENANADCRRAMQAVVGRPGYTLAELLQACADCGTPNPNLIPCDYRLFVIDLKDCFFTIPLHSEDRARFAFTVPVLNHSQPTPRYQWNVLPQGMLNSPTLCQHFVARALRPFRAAHPDALIYHYMDDILVAHPILPDDWLDELRHQLAACGLVIAPDKVQRQPPFLYLGHRMLQSYACPVCPELVLPDPLTFVQLQQLLGSLNWIRPFCPLTTSMLSPLFSGLRQGRLPGDVISVSQEQRQAVTLINRTLAQVWVDRREREQPLFAILLPTLSQPTAVLAQEGAAARLRLIEWIYLTHSPPHTIQTLPQQAAELIFKVRERSRTLLGCDPAAIIVPIPAKDWERAVSCSATLQLSFADYVGEVKYHIPPDPRLSLLQQRCLNLRSSLSTVPIEDALTLFTDGGPTRGAVSWQAQGTWQVRFTLPQRSPQRAELAAVILACRCFQDDPFNLITDSLYVTNVLKSLPGSYVSPSCDDNLLALFLTLQQLLSSRSSPLFVAHIRSHTTLPGLLTEGNAVADQAVKSVASIFSSPLESHAFFHQSAKALAKQFTLPLHQAQAIVRQCDLCASLSNSPELGVNPRGTSANQLWQMEVTHFPSFAPWQYLHVCVDTFSHYVWVTPQKGEASRHAINHMIRAMAIMGHPSHLKTDNGPAYCSSAFASFCTTWDVVHTFGIPYNPTGQAIVERANRALKQALARQKQKGGIPVGLPPRQEWLAAVLFTLNHLNLTDNYSAAERHFRSHQALPRPLVKYRKAPDPQWHGPAPLIT
ncbi:endogenous retrovirus group K member 18 Pol protein [Emys orbicularis]|uniref:endogenous retrovirus group K member 18 Pol protein n=1 Tax=Emys orbicularis TaxID=82168 RepID=UPI0031FBF1AE